MGENNEKSFRDLMKEIISPGLCTVCGTCVAACPHSILMLREESFKRLELHELEVTGNMYQSIEDLCERCGFCYCNCPETMFSLEKAEAKSFGAMAKGDLGHLLGSHMAQATDENLLQNAQCGGVATALLDFVLEQKLADASVAVASTEDQAWKPKPVVVTDRKNLLNTQKTKYTPAATVIGVYSALREWRRSKIAVVATPCQIRGIRTMSISPKGFRKLANSVRLLIGLFCYGTYAYNDLFIRFLAKKHRVDISTIDKIDLDTEKLRVYVNGEIKLEVHRHQIRRYLRRSCRRCSDFTNRLADISLGGVGSPEKWTTVLIRTKRGEEIFSRAVEEGYIRARPLSDEALGRIEELARLKLKEGVIE